MRSRACDMNRCLAPLPRRGAPQDGLQGVLNDRYPPHCTVMPMADAPLPHDRCAHEAHLPINGLRVGVDVVDIARIDRLLATRAQTLTRLFCEREQAYAAARPHPAVTLAGMWAVKEAWAKAATWPLRTHDPRRLEVVHDPCGAPRLTLDAQPVHASISLSHDGPVAVAVVLCAVPE